jgi:hypothetical protein
MEKFSPSFSSFNPPGRLETIAALAEERKLKLEAEQQKASEKKEKSKKPSQPRIVEPEGISQFPKNSLVDLWWGKTFGWRGPYIVKSGLKYGNKLVKISNPATGSQAFVSENKLRKNQIKFFQ